MSGSKKSAAGLLSTPRVATRSDRDRICQLTNSDGSECVRPALVDLDIAVCSLHALLIAKHLEEHPVELQKPKVRDMSTACVYYLKLGGRIKIGTTINLPHRLEQIPHDVLLALEPGSYELEHERHRQFEDIRDRGEWFTISDELTAHVDSIRAQHGHPLDVWIRLKAKDTIAP